VKNFKRIYNINSIIVNNVNISQVVISSHYELKHADSIDDLLILHMVSKLDGVEEIPEAEEGIYVYFVSLIKIKNKQYRLIWLLEHNKSYIGIINAYRDQRKGKLYGIS
jgi:hypothetical protein